MRTHDVGILGDHQKMIAEPDTHHPRSVSFRFSINGESIGALSLLEKRVDIGTGHKVIRAVLRGKNNVAILGHDGVWCIGTDAIGSSSANGMRPYGAGGYLSCYVGGYSRLHGDSYLSGWSIFGTGVLLQDVRIDGSDAVFAFYNRTGVVQQVRAWGSAVVK